MTKVRIENNTKRVANKVRARSIETLGQAGAFIRTAIRFSIRKGKNSAPAGSPPRTRQGALKNAILFAVEKDQERVTIGPAASRLGRSTGGAHEFGGEFRGRQYPARPYLAPALDKAASKLPEKWQNIIKGA